mgnify:CR=1 FL=1
MSAANGTVPVIELANVTMDFGTVKALERVSMSVAPGEVVGLVGDNGAGKSTLVKVITGYHSPTSGRLTFDGREVRFNSPAAARALGIEMVYQDLAIVNELSMWRNFFLGKEIRRRIGPFAILKTNEMRHICFSELQAIGLTGLRSANEPASVLSGGERQSLAICRAVHFGARLLLLDEPTAALSVRETQSVFRAVDAARKRGLGVIYIDHNLAHVHPIADRIVFLEHGRIHAVLRPMETTLQELVELVARRPPAAGPPTGEPVGTRGPIAEPAESITEAS